MVIRERYEANERQMLSKNALLSENSKGRRRPDEVCEVRTCFQQDIDRIIHSKAFRRLKHKTQVFLSPEGDHYRTRLTHVLEVNRIARTIARALRLNEDLAEAIALGHDLGHTPFGHAGEFTLNGIVPGGFTHNGQGVRVVEKLERDGRGLNLCAEVIDGIACHTGKKAAGTLEGRILPFADKIAYINHDIDDAVRAGVLGAEEIPQRLSAVLGDGYSERINTMVRDVIENSAEEISMSEEVGGAMLELRSFMFGRVYSNPLAKSEESKAKVMLTELYGQYVKRPELLPPEYLRLAEEDGTGRAACDYIAGMTDKFAVRQFSEIFIPLGWEQRTLI
ncbi:MAG: deoxyguanosinetriphosphate triphosphohydrolase [Oscillospiraceae bacterium]|jgi:dGTPase|nr:deoxyguanosinetriphosphate triphosphohydrolase [Oscillospiraceae bacterium]